MSIEAMVKEAMEFGVKLALTQQIQDIAMKETRAALLEREQELTALIRAGVRAAIEDMLK